MNVKPVALIVDDDHDVCDIYSGFMVDAGYHVVTAHSGADAKSLLEVLLPAVVLTDIAMPDGNGLEVRDFAAALGVPVVLVSGHLRPYQHFLRDTVALEKPFPPNELVNAASLAISTIKSSKRTLTYE